MKLNYQNRQHQINNFHSHAVTGKVDDSFVGIKIRGNDIHFYYPESYHFDENDKNVRNDVIDLIKTIAIAKTTSLQNAKAYNSHVNGGEFALTSYLWVINDYLSNGFYVNREKVYKLNQNGRINWKRTLQQQPIVSNGNVIYKDIVVEVKNDRDNLLVDIHKYCVKKSIDFIGWLFNLDSRFIESKPFNKSIKKLYVNTLNKELDSTFDDDKRMRLMHLKNVLIGLDDSSQDKDFVYGVDTYYYVFERMIDSIFGNQESIKDFNPKANWYLARNNYTETKSSELRPDTILIKDNKAFIIDSKFYRFGFTGNESDLPETTSIQKQITYGEYIKKVYERFKLDEIYNAFILPYDKQRDVFKSNDNIQYIGYAKAEWKDNDQVHEKIHAFLIDLKHVIKTWNKYNHEEDVELLINNIVEKKEDF